MVFKKSWPLSGCSVVVVSALRQSMATEPAIGCQADNDRNEGAYRGSQAHRIEGGRVKTGKKIGQRQAGEDDGHHIVAEGNGGIATSHEESAEAKMNASQEAVEDITAEVLAALDDDRRIGGEEANGYIGNELEQQGYGQAETTGDIDGIAQGLSGTDYLSGTNALGGDGRHCGQHGRRYNEEQTDELLDNADRSGIDQASSVGNHRDGNEGNLDEAVLKCHWHTDTEDISQGITMETEVAAG